MSRAPCISHRLCRCRKIGKESQMIPGNIMCSMHLFQMCRRADVNFNAQYPAPYSYAPVVRESRFLPPDTVGSIWQRSCLIREKTVRLHVMLRVVARRVLGQDTASVSARAGSDTR